MTKGYPDWLRAFLLLGKHGADYLPVLLGPDGSLYCVLQGDYLGELKTVKLDDQGRLSAFVVDSSDQFGKMLEVGNAELAARIAGWPVSYDRRGQVLCYEQFDCGLGAYKRTLSEGCTAALDPVLALQGGYAVHLYTAAAAGNYASIKSTFPPLAAGTSIGAAVFFSLAGNFDDWRLTIEYSTTLALFTACCRLTRADFKIWLYNSAGGWTEIGTWTTPALETKAWHYLKFVVNSATADYRRVIIDGVEIDASAIKCYEELDGSPQFRVDVMLGGSVNGTGESLVDCITLTTQEP
ncbi:MAG: hypothetical protein Q8N51_09260 [Gammaproteobacteria bacterium]|nr:hypothetical protein [Gammaproteobacteria bacterium]